MLKTKRIAIMILCIIMCVSSLRIPTSASVNGEYCDTNGHDYRKKYAGSLGPEIGGDNYSCHWHTEYQCCYECYYCGKQLMKNDYNQCPEPHTWYWNYYPERGGWAWKCSKCGYDQL